MNTDSKVIMRKYVMLARRYEYWNPSNSGNPLESMLKVAIADW